MKPASKKGFAFALLWILALATSVLVEGFLLFSTDKQSIAEWQELKAFQSSLPDVAAHADALVEVVLAVIRYLDFI